MPERKIVDASEMLGYGLLDSLRLGLALGALSNEIDPDDLGLAIAATRDLDQLLYVNVKGYPVS